jgi:voltage-gated potassium channel
MLEKFQQSKHTNKRLASIEKHRELVVAFLFLGFVILSSTLGYIFLEHWSFFEGLYMTFMTLTTIGFGEMHPLSQTGRIWTMCIGIVGIGTVFFILGRTAEMLFRGTKIYERNMQRAISQLDNHIILCGFGRIGERIARELMADEQRFVIIEQNEERCAFLKQEGYLYITGNAEQEHVLQSAGITRAKSIVLTLAEDRDNAFTALLARGINPNIFILARTNYEHNINLLRRAGADKVMSPYEIGAARMAQRLLRPHVHQFMEKVEAIESLDLVIEEFMIGDASPLAKRTLIESDLRHRFGIIVIAIHDSITHKTEFNPEPNMVIMPKHILIVMGNDQKMRDLEKECQG